MLLLCGIVFLLYCDCGVESFDGLIGGAWGWDWIRIWI